MDFVIWSMVTRKIEREPVHHLRNDVPGYSLSYTELSSTFNGAVAVPFIVNVWTAGCGSIFCKLMVSAIIVIVASYHLAAAGVEIINISIDLHNTALKFAGISC